MNRRNWSTVPGQPSGPQYTWAPPPTEYEGPYGIETKVYAPVHIHEMDHQHLDNTINMLLRKAAAKHFNSSAAAFTDTRTRAGVHFPFPPLRAILEIYPYFVWLLEEQASRKSNPGYALSSERAFEARMLKGDRNARTWTDEERELYNSRLPRRIPRYRPRD